VWWDWLVINNDYPYVQAEFEVAMAWATQAAHQVFIQGYTLLLSDFVLDFTTIYACI
jgi:hypothetical protein